MPSPSAIPAGGSVQQGLSAAGGALGFYQLGLAADKRYSLSLMRQFLFLALAALVLPQAFAQIPEGFSAWSYVGPCDADCRSIGRRPTSTYVWMLRTGKLLCGLAEQDYGLESWNKSPSGRFAGQLGDGRFEIQFNDSFSDPSTPGAAYVYSRKGRLVFETFKNPSHGYLSLGEGPLRRELRAKPPSKSDHYKACVAFTGDVDQYLSVLP